MFILKYSSTIKVYKIVRLHFSDIFCVYFQIITGQRRQVIGHVITFENKRYPIVPTLKTLIARNIFRKYNFIQYDLLIKNSKSLNISNTLELKCISI